MHAARGEDFALDIEGVERLTCTSASIAPEAACTSVQLHLQVTPARFADVWNAAQAIAPVQIAVGANSPFLFGQELWRESRPPLFLQATDIRPPELRAQGVRPRTWFGERWIDSVHDLFEENLRYFPPLLPICDDGGPAAGAGRRRRSPAAPSSILHNGTIYRWNRPVYEVATACRTCASRTGCCLPGPRSSDVIANTAFYYGLVRALAEASRPVWKRLAFEDAAANFDVPAGTASRPARLAPPRPLHRYGEAAAVQLVRDELLPLAAAGLDAWGIEPRTGTGTSGSSRNGAAAG